MDLFWVISGGFWLLIKGKARVVFVRLGVGMEGSWKGDKMVSVVALWWWPVGKGWPACFGFTYNMSTKQTLIE